MADPNDERGARITELLEANNAEVERRREAEEQVETLTLALAEEQAKVAELELERDDEIRMATSISVASCEHGSVFVRLHDKAGQIFAAACMPMVTALEMSGEIVDAIEAIAEPGAGDTIGECAGHG